MRIVIHQEHSTMKRATATSDMGFVNSFGGAHIKPVLTGQKLTAAIQTTTAILQQFRN